MKKKNSVLSILKRSFVFTCILSLVLNSVCAMASTQEPANVPKTSFFMASQNDIVSGNTVTVIKKTPAIIKYFTTSEGKMNEGNGVRLVWEVIDAISVTINGAKVDNKGYLEVDPKETTTYVIEAIGTDGVIVKLSVTVTVIPEPEINSFTASATNVEKGTLVTIKWDTEYATNCEIVTDDGLKLSKRAADGQIAITPNSTKTYTLIAYNVKNVTAKSSITITVK